MPDCFWGLDCLVDLNLSHNLLERLARRFGSARTLTNLDLSHNYLQHVPDWFNDLSRARTVRLNDNTMSSSAFDYVAQNFGRNCRALRSLDISGCAIRGFSNHHVFGARDLKELVLGRPGGGDEELSPAAANLLKNSLHALPKEVSHSVGLVTLIASGIDISDIPEEIGLLKKLKRLDLSHNDIYWLPSTLKELTLLEVVNVNNNHLDSLQFRIEQLPNLREIYAAFNEICWITEDIGKSRARVRTLDLYGNRLDLEGARPLQDLDLLELDLGRNDIGLDGIEQDMAIKDYREKQRALRSRLEVLEVRTDPEEETVQVRPAWEEEEAEEPECGSCPEVREESVEDPSESEEESEPGNFFKQEVEEDKDRLSPRASPPCFPWHRLQEEEGDGGGEGEEEEEEEEEDGRGDDDDNWSDDQFSKFGCRNHTRAPQYDFDDMGKYCSGRFDFCPSDRHAKSMRTNFASGGGGGQREQGGGVVLDPMRPGRRRRGAGVSPRQSPAVGTKNTGSSGGQFDDAE